MTTWYRAPSWSDAKVEPVEAVRETAAFVVLANERREAKGINGGDLFPTYAEARDKQISRARERLTQAQRSLDYARSKLAEAERIPKEPKP